MSAVTTTTKLERCGGKGERGSGGRGEDGGWGGVGGGARGGGSLFWGQLMLFECIRIYVLSPAHERQRRAPLLYLFKQNNHSLHFALFSRSRLDWTVLAFWKSF